MHAVWPLHQPCSLELWTSAAKPYAPESVDREAAVQQGYVAYAKAFDQAPAQARIGEHPLVLRALRVAGETRVDLVLSDAEATRMRDYAATRRLVRQCRVLIVM